MNKTRMQAFEPANSVIQLENKKGRKIETRVIQMNYIL